MSINIKLMDNPKELLMIEIIKHVPPDLKMRQIGVFYRNPGEFRLYDISLIGSDRIERLDEHQPIKHFDHAGEFLNEIQNKGIVIGEHRVLADLADECGYYSWLIDSNSRKKSG